MLRSLFDRLNRQQGAPSAAGCGFDGSRLLAYHDRELTGIERKQVEAHLEQCASCRAELAGHDRAESALLSAGATLTSPGDLRSEFYARLERSQRRPARIGWQVAVPAAACAGLLLVFGRTLLLQPPAPRGGVANTAAGVAPAQSGRLADDDGQHKSVPSAPVAASTPSPSARAIGHGMAAAAHNATSAVAAASTGRRRGRFPLFTVTIRPATRTVAQRRVRRPMQVAIADVNLHSRTAGGPGVDGATATYMSDTAADRSFLFERPAGAGLLAERNRKTTSGPAYSLAFADGEPRRDERELRDSPRGAAVVLASLPRADLHVSDESRDFMASTHIDAEGTRRAKRETVRVEDDNDTAAESVELPPIP
ncbi:MAG TPA: anti-sigma factor [Chthonomonadaceae bacterium]|nr:anti-sigma factor [Chthonomonadaceae bacterium]